MQLMLLPRLLVLNSDDLLEEVYDNDKQVGPLYKRDIEDESIILMEIFNLAGSITQSPLSKSGDELIPKLVLNSNIIGRDQLDELYNTFEVRGMSKTGLNAVSVAQLKTGVADRMTIFRDCLTFEVENIAGIMFQPSV